MKPLRKITHRINAFWLIFLLAGCSLPEPTLSPAPSADRPPGEPDTAVARVDGVYAVVKSSSWPADPTVATKLTPLHVRIENDSDVPILVRYQEFALIGPEGQYYSALPPLAAKIDVAESTAEFTATRPISNPSFRHQGFFVAPFYGYAYGTIPVWQHDFRHDPFYYDTYHTTYKELDISVEELNQWALPEGVIASGGSLSGYLYFEHVDPALSHVEFRGNIVNAETGRTLGAIMIPFTVGQN